MDAGTVSVLRIRASAVDSAADGAKEVDASAAGSVAIDEASARAAERATEIRWLGRIAYEQALDLQLALRDARLRGEVGDTALLVEHPDVITFGSRGRGVGAHAQPSDAELRARGYAVHQVRRGGEATYHGPGQLVGYPVLDLRRRRLDVAAYLRALEDVLIAVAAEVGVACGRRPGYTGVWVDERRKLASIGVGIRRWVTTHGFALNVSCDLARFDAIVPCGLEGVEMVSLSSVSARAIELADVRERTAAALLRRFP